MLVVCVVIKGDDVVALDVLVLVVDIVVMVVDELVDEVVVVVLVLVAVGTSNDTKYCIEIYCNFKNSTECLFLIGKF